MSNPGSEADVRSRGIDPGMRIHALLLLSILAFSGICTAQHHANGYAGSSAAGEVFLVDPLGKVTTLKAGLSPIHGLVMDSTNSLLVAASADGNLYEIDPVSAAVVGTLASGLILPHDIVVDNNGDYFVTGNTQLWRVDTRLGVTTLTTLLPSPCQGGMVLDVDTGDLLIQSQFGQESDPLLRVARDGSRVAILGIGADARYGITQDIRTGDVYTGTCCGDYIPSKNIQVLESGKILSSVWLSGIMEPAGIYSLKADRSSADFPRLILGAFNQPNLPGRGGGIYAVDLANRNISRLTTLLPSLYETEILYRRNLHARMNGKGKWTLGIHIPEDAGKTYIMGLSLSGVRPGFVLGDGRRVNLEVDSITILGIFGFLNPVVTGTTGVLDSGGKAAGHMDLTGLPPSINGMLFWFLVLTLDSAAPSSIKTITDPLVLEVEGL